MIYKKIKNRPRPVVLLILDGFGIAPPYPGNAIANANMVNFTKLLRSYPHGLLNASGSAVGLPHGVMGNSEVGHMNIGAGRIVYQTLPRINTSITNGAFYNNEAVLKGIEHCHRNNSNFHIMGCASTGNVHATIEHLFAILLTLKKHNFNGNRIFIHAFTDGRDTDPHSGKNFLTQIESFCRQLGMGRIVSIIGRYYAMDRNNKWARIQKAYDLIVKGQGQRFSSTEEAMNYFYNNNITDEFIEPSIIENSEYKFVPLQEGDTLFFYNYRGDRAVQLTKAIVEKNFNQFPTVKFQKLFFICMTQYDKTLRDKVHLAFPPELISIPLGRVISEAGLRQLRLAETEKFPHVTYFLNGGRELIFNREDRILVPSPNVATYDLKPEMSTYELTQVLIEKLKLNIYDFIAMNIACADMVGHTGNYQATVKAIQAIDENIDKIVKHVLAIGGAVVITADHGNAEVMIDYQTGKPHTEHTTNPVPIIFAMEGLGPQEIPMGALCDIAPTILDIMGLPIPATMAMSRRLL